MLSTQKWFKYPYESQEYIILGKGLNYKQHFKLPLGDYAQVHENEEPRNSMKERTLGAICLGPLDNAQGGYKFMSLRTGALIKRYSWTAIPMTQEVIDRVIYLGEKSKVPQGVIIRNGRGHLDHHEFEYDDIEGVYDYDLQKNLYPSPNTQHNDDDSTDSNIPDSVCEGELNDAIDVTRNKKSVVEDLEGNLEELPEEVIQETTDQETIMSMVEEMEENFDNVIEGFNDIDRDIDERLQNLEDDNDIDETPVKRNRKKPEKYEPSFKNRSYTSIKGVHDNNSLIDMDEKTHAQVMQKIFTQMSFKKGIEKYGNSAIEGMKKELRQMHLRNSFIPKHKKDLTEQQWKNKCEAVNLIKEKSDGTIKGRCCADGRQQRKWISREESASPTAATESVLLTGVIEAKEQRNVITLDVPNAFIQTYLENEEERIILVLRGKAAEILIGLAPEVYKEYAHTEKEKTVLYLECTNVIYGTIKAALLFYQKFRKDIEAQGFIVNPYDRCVANKIINGSQMTVLWHVDDLKASHKETKVLEEFVQYLRTIYDDEEIGKIKLIMDLLLE